VPRDVLVELDVHRPAVPERAHQPRLGLARIEEAQRLGARRPADEDPALARRRLRDAVAGLNDRRLGGRLGALHPRDAPEEAADRDGVDGVVRPPGSITFSRSSGVGHAAVTCTPPMPRHQGIGI